MVIEKALLGGAQLEELQRVATVYRDGREFRVYAPSRATGHATEWAGLFSVRTPSKSPSGAGEIDVDDNLAARIIREVVDEFKRNALNSDIWSLGTDGRFYPALICLHGHTIHVDSRDTLRANGGRREEHCEACGSRGISACVHCKTPIRGKAVMSRVDYILPAFCYNCGRAYPWMEDRLETARELLWHDDKLTLDDREKLWGLLQYVISDPKSDLVPAKKKLIESDLGKAAIATRDFMTDLLAKYFAEMSKP